MSTLRVDALLDTNGDPLNLSGSTAVTDTGTQTIAEAINARKSKTSLSKSVAGGVDVTLTAAEAANAVITLTGTITADINVIVPDDSNQWLFINDTTGAFAVTVKTLAGTGKLVTQGGSELLRSDGTNVEYYTQTSGSIIQREFLSTGDVVSTTGIIPEDDTIPQITEGGEALSITFTPKRSDSRIRIRSTINARSNTTSATLICALFDGSADSIGVGSSLGEIGGGSSYNNVTVVADVTSAGTKTFSVRFGAQVAATTYLNGTSSGNRLYGGLYASSLEIEEYAP